MVHHWQELASLTSRSAGACPLLRLQAPSRRKMDSRPVLYTGKLFAGMTALGPGILKNQSPPSCVSSDRSAGLVPRFPVSGQGAGLAPKLSQSRTRRLASNEQAVGVHGLKQSEPFIERKFLRAALRGYVRFFKERAHVVVLDAQN